MTCPKCGSESTPFLPRTQVQELVLLDWKCLNCGHKWSQVVKRTSDEDENITGFTGFEPLELSNVKVDSDE